MDQTAGIDALKPAFTESEARFDGILDTAVDGIIVMNARMQVLVFNKACESLFGFEANEVLGQNVSMIMPADYARAHDKYVTDYLDTGEKKIIGIGREVRGRHKDGTEFPIELSVGEADTPDGRQFIGIMRDLRPRKSVEQRLAQTQAQLMHMTRISAMDEMGAAIAHELNQPLTAILLYLQAVSRKARGGDPLDEKAMAVMGKAVQEAERAGEIIQRMRQFVEKREPERSEIELNEFVSGCVELVELGSGESGVTFTSSVEDGLPPLQADQVQIRQVVVNLLRNAREAVTKQSDKRVSLGVSRSDDMFVFRIADSGPGVPDTMKPELFKAFAGQNRKGLGLGLAISRTIAQNHGGDLQLEPQKPGAGASFLLTLPI